eukprot:EG_transcript_8875
MWWRVALRRSAKVLAITTAGGGLYVVGSIERTHRLVEYKTYQEPGPDLVKAAAPWKVALRFVQLSFWAVPLILMWLVCHRFQSAYVLWCHAFKRMLEHTGPAFVKLGQWMAIRSDLFPKEFCDVLSDLHDNVRPHGMRHTRRVIERSFGRKVEDLFSDFPQKPVGSGSIAQVYVAELKETGEKVAVKVAHPRVREAIAVDFRCIEIMAEIMDPAWRWMDFPGIAKQFSRNLSLQVDLRFEAENLEAFNKNFENSKYIMFPKPVQGLCGEQVLVESYIPGKSLTEYYIDPVKQEIDPPRQHLARCGADLVFQMVLTDNFFHADIHPGNILVGHYPNDPMPYMGVLDVGVTQTLTQEQRDVAHSFMASIVRKDWHKTSHSLLAMSHKQEFCDKEAFEKAILAHCSSMLPTHVPKTLTEKAYHYGRKFGLLAHAPKRTLFATDFVQGIFNIIQEQHVKIDPPYASLLFSCLMMEFMVNKVDPKMDVVMYSAPWFVSNAYKTPKRLAI